MGINSDQDSKSLSIQRYTQYGQSYVTSQTHAKGAELGLLIDIAQPQADWFVLDIATGGGHTALKFAPHVRQVIATDITPKMVERARNHISAQGVENVHFKPADAEDLPFEDEQFNLVTCRIAPHHFLNCRRFIRESVRVVKPAGLLLIQDQMLPEEEEAARYVDRFEKLRDPSHHHAYSRSEWLSMFREAGLCIERTEQVLIRHAFIPWAKQQRCTQEIIDRLVNMLVEAPPLVAEWLDAQDVGTPQSSFVNHHMLIAGRKAE